jgi:hypothetical protein
LARVQKKKVPRSMVQPSAKARDSAEAKRRRPLFVKKRGEDEGRIIPAAH